MSLRSWAIRGLILAGVAALAALGWLANSWVSPERVRAQVIAHLSEQFEGVDVHVGSAHMRILGGIAVTDLKLTRPGPDGTETSLLEIPSAILYHDKEQLNRGRLVIRKVELENPELHLERGPDGKWNVAEVLKPAPADKPVPTFVIKGGTIHVTDHGPDPLPPVTLTDAQPHAAERPAADAHDPGAARTAKGYGPVNVRGAAEPHQRRAVARAGDARRSRSAKAAVAAERFAPDLAPHLGGLNATASVTADLTYTPDAAKKWRHDVRLDLKDARFTHPDLPWPVEKIAASVRIVDGRVKVEDATAQIAGAAVKLSLETRTGNREARNPKRRNPTTPSNCSKTTSSGSTCRSPGCRSTTTCSSTCRTRRSRPGGCSPRPGRSMSGTSSPARRAGGSANSRCARSRSRWPTRSSSTRSRTSAGG